METEKDYRLGIKFNKSWDGYFIEKLQHFDRTKYRSQKHYVICAIQALEQIEEKGVGMNKQPAGVNVGEDVKDLFKELKYEYLENRFDRVEGLICNREGRTETEKLADVDESYNDNEDERCLPEIPLEQMNEILAAIR